MFRLAGHLKKTVAELEQALPESEFQEWLKLDERELIPDPRQDAALICYAINRSMGGKADVDNFRLVPAPPKPPPKPLTPQETVNVLSTWFAGRTKRRAVVPGAMS